MDFLLTIGHQIIGKKKIMEDWPICTFSCTYLCFLGDLLTLHKPQEDSMALPSSHIYSSEELLLPTDSLQNFVHLVFFRAVSPFCTEQYLLILCLLDRSLSAHALDSASKHVPTVTRGEVHPLPSPNAEVEFTPSPNPPSHCPPTSLQ